MGAQEGFHFIQMKGAGAAAAKDDSLAAGFIHHPIAVESAGDGEHGFLGRIGGDELR